MECMYYLVGYRVCICSYQVEAISVLIGGALVAEVSPEYGGSHCITYTFKMLTNAIHS
jgi:hypothetical protein